MPRFMENGVMKLASDALKPIRSYYRREVRLDLPPGAHFMYRGDNNMSPRTEPSMYLDADVFCSEFSSDDVIIVGHEKQQQYTLVGAVTALRSLTFLTLIMKGANMHAIEVRQPDIGEGDTPEEIIVLKGGDWRDLLAEYARRTARRMQVPPLDTRRNLTGYCTWYYYYAEVTEKDFLENVEAMRRHLDGAYRAQVVQIDDGYQTFQGDWTRSGDKYVRSGDGYYTYSGRSDDMLKVSGQFVSPFQVESAIASHEAVLEAAVIGQKDLDDLVKPKAFVVLKPGFQPGDALVAELKQHVKDTLAPFKYPRWIEFLDELPKTATGKIQRYKLRGGA